MLSFVLLLAAFVLGCAVQLQQGQLWWGWMYALFCLPCLIFAALGAIKERATARAKLTGGVFGSLPSGLFLALLFAAVGFGQTGWRATSFASQAIAPSLEGRDIRITGVVAAMPQRDESGLRFRLDVESAQMLQDGASQAIRLPPRVQLSWYRSLPRLSEDTASVPFAELQAGSGDLRAGERWQMVARLKAPHGNLNPHGFDYELWLWEQGIQATGYVRATAREAARRDEPVRLGETWQHPIESGRQRVRDAIFDRIASPALAGVIAALVVGDQAAIDRADWDIYRATGVAHLMSISGLHITMFAWGAALMIGMLWRRRMGLTHAMPAQHAALLGGVVLASAYALFSGWGVPAQRTVWMLAAVAVLRLSGKRWPWPLIWLAVLALIVALDPWALLSAGFWLSFVAVGVLFASDRGRGEDHLVDHLDTAAPPTEALPRSWWKRVRRQAVNMWREQWVITLALAPLSLLLFNQVSVVGLFANVLAIPWVTLVVTPMAMLGIVFAPLWDAAAVAVQGLGLVLGWLAQWEFATISVASSAAFISAVAVFGGILCASPLPAPLRCMGVLMMLPVILVQPLRPKAGEFALLAADIGQGNAVLVQTLNHSLLYDTGPRFSRESDAGQRTLVPLLRALGERLDIVMVSHRDADHIGGAAAVLKMQAHARLISSIEPEHELQTVRSSEPCMAGQRWQWDGVMFEILHPTAADYETRQKPNAMSCVLRISNGRQAALLVGDLEAAQEEKLVAAQIPLKANLLLVPHHGSKTSSTPRFLDAVQPQVAWVQAGYRNRFQHPVPIVMARYEERGVLVVGSPSCGAAMWSSDTPQTRCQRDLARRYWHHQP